MKMSSFTYLNISTECLPLLACAFTDLQDACRQPFMDFAEDVIRARYPNLRALYYEKVFYLPAFGRVPLNPLKLISRTTLVCITTVIVSLLLSPYLRVCSNSCIVFCVGRSPSAEPQMTYLQPLSPAIRSGSCRQRIISPCIQVIKSALGRGPQAI